MKRRMQIKDEGTNQVDAIVGQKLRELRMLAGLSQSDLAATINLTFQQLQKYERGVNRISASKLYLLARHLNVPVSAFFVDLDRPPAQDASGRREPAEQEAFEDGDQMGRSREALILARNFQRIADPKAKAALKAFAEACAAMPRETDGNGASLEDDSVTAAETPAEASDDPNRSRRPRGAIWHPTDIART